MRRVCTLFPESLSYGHRFRRTISKRSTMFERIQVLITALLLAAIVIWLQFYQLETQSLLDQFDFDAAVLWAEPWRIFSAHLFHLDTQHAISNAIGVLLPTVFFLRHFTVRTWLNAFIIIAASTSII